MPSNDPDALALAWALLHAAGVGSTRLSMVAAAGGPQTLCRTLFAQASPPPMPLLRALLGPARAAAWAAGTPHGVATLRGWIAALRAHLAAGGRIWTPGPPEGRDRLARAPGAPLCAYGRGPDLRGAPGLRVAVVGTRLPSPGGVHHAESLGAALGRGGAWVLSGGARGIDLAAHRGCLAAGGNTLALLGEPLAPTTPAAGRGPGGALPARLSALGERLATLSPFGPWVTPARHLFAARNRWLVALADAVVVVEAAPRSGTSHTIEAALRLGVPLFAVAAVHDAYLSATPQRLVREGLAQPCSDAASILSALAAMRAGGPAGPQRVRESPVDAPIL